MVAHKQGQANYIVRPCPCLFVFVALLVCFLWVGLFVLCCIACLCGLVNGLFVVLLTANL